MSNKRENEDCPQQERGSTIKAVEHRPWIMVPEDEIDCHGRRRNPSTTVIEWDVIIGDFLKKISKTFIKYFNVLWSLSISPVIYFKRRIHLDHGKTSGTNLENPLKASPGIVAQKKIVVNDNSSKPAKSQEDELYELIVQGDEPNKGLYVYRLAHLGTQKAIGYLESLLNWDYRVDNADIELVNRGAVDIATRKLFRIYEPRDRDKLVETFLRAMEEGNDQAKISCSVLAKEIRDSRFVDPLITLMRKGKDEETQAMAALSLISLANDP